MKHLLRITPPYLGKINFVGLLCSLFLLASCSQDDNEPIPSDDEPQAVTLTINLEDAYTRTISEDKDNDLTRLLIQMVDNDVLQTDIKTISLASGQTTASYELYASHEYTFLLWADDGSYNAEDLTNITLDSSSLSGTQAGLSYAATATWDGSSANIPVTLTHVASKVTLKTTTDVWAGNTLTLTVPKASTGYNVQTGTATATTEEYEHSIITTDITASENRHHRQRDQPRRTLLLLRPGGGRGAGPHPKLRRREHHRARQPLRRKAHHADGRRGRHDRRNTYFEHPRRHLWRMGQRHHRA